MSVDDSRQGDALTRRVALSMATGLVLATGGYLLLLVVIVRDSPWWWFGVATAMLAGALAVAALVGVQLVRRLRKRLTLLSSRVSGLSRSSGDAGSRVAAQRSELGERLDALERRADVKQLADRLAALEQRLSDRDAASNAALETRLSLLEDARSRAEAGVKEQLDQIAATQRLALEDLDSMKKRQQILTARSRRSLQVVAESADALGVDLTKVISLPDAQLVLRDSLAEGQAARAVPAVKAFELLPRQDLATLRKLYAAFRASGHWDVALEAVDLIATKSGKKGDQAAARRSRQELEVFSGPPPVLPVAASPARDEAGPILHLVGKVLPFTQSGYTLRTHYTAQAQMRRGMRVVVVGQSGSGEGQGEQRYTHDRVDYVVLEGPNRNSTGLRAWMRSNMERLAALIKDLRPSIIHAHSDFLNAYVAHAVGSAYGIPVVYEVRGFWEESWLSRVTHGGGASARVSMHQGAGITPLAYSLRKRAEERARSLPDHLFTLAGVMKRHIIQSADGDLPEGAVSIVPNGVTPAVFPRQQRDAELGALLGIPEGAVTIGYVSSFVEYEGVDTLIDAFKLVQGRTQTPVRLLLVGDGKHGEALREHAASAGQDGITFTGAVPHEEVLKYYGLIDIFVVPRRRSSVTELVTPLKPYEAFSTGRSVVLSDVRALREIAEDSGAAELFEPDDAASLAEVLTRLVADPERRARLSAKGSSWVRAHRTWERNASTYLEEYRRLGYEGVV